MRTTIRLNESLLRQAKRLAAETGRTFTALVEESLAEAIARGSRAPRARPIRLKTSRGAFRAGVNLDSGAALRDQMDGLA